MSQKTKNQETVIERLERRIEKAKDSHAHQLSPRDKMVKIRFLEKMLRMEKEKLASLQK